MDSWSELKQFLSDKLNELDDDLKSKLALEIKEIEKQSSQKYILDAIKENKKYSTNKNGLVYPWVLGLTDVHPTNGKHDLVQQTDYPDIDLDCVPSSRDKIKEYIIDKYGSDKVVSVGTWMTYKFKSAMQDVIRARGGDLGPVFKLSEQLAQSVDDLKENGMGKCESCGTMHNAAICPQCQSEDTDYITFGKALQEFPALKAYYDSNKETVDLALRLVGKIKCLGTHAGGVIISNKNIFGSIPLAISNGKWTSMWTEGSSSQLSKIGYIKWDILGLSTLEYVHYCCKMINRTRGIKFDPVPWMRKDKERGIIGCYEDENGKTIEIKDDDQNVFKMLNDLRIETIFQFDTNVQKGVLQNGVRNFNDMQVFNAMGHPGPLACLSSYSKIKCEQDDKEISKLDNKVDKLVYFNQAGQPKTTNNYTVINNGKRKIYRLKLKNGMTVDLTEDHRVKTDHGYVQVKDLKNGKFRCAVVKEV